MVKVFTDPHNPQAWKSLVAAKFNGVQVETPAFNPAVDSKSDDFLRKSPVGKYPVLEVPEGVIFEPNAAARYVARLGKNRLYGSTAWESGSIDNWIEFSANEVLLPGSVWVFPILGYIPDNATATQKAKGDVRRALDILNKHLTTRTFLVGQRISLADIVVAADLYRLYQRVLDAGFRKPFVHTNRWFLTVVNQPEFKSVAGDIKLAEKMEVAPKVEAAAAAPAEKKEGKKEKAKEEKPKEQPKKEEKKKEKDADEEEENEFEEKPKGKNPLDALPPSKLNLEEWKRVYSNKDTRKEAMPWFWETYDPEGFSIWIGDYKYNDELERILMTSNLLGGFIQRLDKLRKYGFGTMIIFGQEPKLQVAVCFLFRGSEVPAEMKECDDSEHYNWRKLNTSDPSEKELVNDFWAWEGTFGGKYLPYNSGKTFK